MKIVLVFAMALGIFSCNNSIQKTDPVLKDSTSSKTIINDSAILIQLARECISDLKQNNNYNLGRKVHSKNGIWIVPMVHIDSNCFHLYPFEIAKSLTNGSIHFFGFADGSGDSINMSFADYKKKYLLNRNYENASPKILSKPFRYTNTKQNVQDFFPGSKLVDFTINPNEDMDWGSLIFVFEKGENRWQLVAILNNYWTI